MIVYGLIIMTSVSILLVSIISFVAAQMRAGMDTVSQHSAFQIAESGVSFYRWYLAHEVDGKTAQQIKSFWAGGTAYGVDAPYEAEYVDSVDGAIGRYRITVTPPDPGSTIVDVVSEGWTYKRPGLTRTIKVRFRRPSWSEYMILDNNMFRLSESTVIYGKMHSNNGVHFDGQANNVVSSAVSTYYDIDYSQTKPGVWTAWSGEYNSTLGSQVFLAGKQYPVTNIDFNGVLSDLGLMKSEAQSGNGKYFDGSGEGQRIILKTDGTFDACTVRTYDENTTADGYSSSHTNAITSYSGTRSNGNSCTSSSCTSSGTCVTRKTYPIVSDGVIFVEDNVWLEGVIDGKRLSVVAADLSGGSSPNVFLYNNLTYTNHDGTDVLGVIAQNDIELIRDSANNITLEGAFLAKEGRLGRKYYDGTVKNSITINGAIASFGRIGFGYVNNTGYLNRSLNFDNNLLYTPPPYFPTGTQYLMDLWEEVK